MKKNMTLLREMHPSFAPKVPLLTRSRIAGYVRRLTEYAAEMILSAVSSTTSNIDTTIPTKVGGWLTNKVATDWHNVRKYPATSGYIR